MFGQITDVQSSRCVTFLTSSPFLITLHKSRSAAVMIKIAHISIISPERKSYQNVL